ncbi:endonuclease/exonuclease/phosphatase family protein [Flavobacterium sp. Sd200]|nr:endonuclease/exonuclease/phosphatase family protein [Flavobacterium sp. Sd200]MXN92550.1 endonuclease/exonuclease/phosphatase family protein [Flavobacterium sp. Sd200]
MIKSFSSFLFIVLIGVLCNAQDKKFKVHTVAFYNVENLFDTHNDPKINDEEWLPDGRQHWTEEKYKKKLSNLAKVISQIGTTENPGNSPVVIGVAEVENRGVLEDLIKEPLLAGKDYGIVHIDSPDKRGIDVGFLYQKKYFKPTSYKNFPLLIYDKNALKLKKKLEEDKAAGKTTDDDEEGVVINVDLEGRRYTRDQLLVTGYLDGEEMSFIINHWPSRSGGEKVSAPFREAAAALNKKIIDSLYKVNPNAKVITMGDLNDGPYNNSVKGVLGAKAKKEDTKKGGLYNPMEEMSNKGIGTLAYRDAWDLFDQMIMTEPLIQKDYTSFRFWKAGVYNKTFMTQPSGAFKGYPLRNSNGNVGYSDHFPVYVYLIKQM